MKPLVRVASVLLPILSGWFPLPSSAEYIYPQEIYEKLFNPVTPVVNVSEISTDTIRFSGDAHLSAIGRKYGIVLGNETQPWIIQSDNVNTLLINFTSPIDQIKPSINSIPIYVDILDEEIEGSTLQTITPSHTSIDLLTIDGRIIGHHPDYNGELLTAVDGQTFNSIRLTHTDGLGQVTLRDLTCPYFSDCIKRTAQIGMRGMVSDIYYHPVPEPETYALFMLGLAFIGLYANRNHRSWFRSIST